MEARSTWANATWTGWNATSRRLFLGEAGHIVVSDTVGFVRELPHQLVAAFKTTLEETIHADLLLHVVDASSPTRMDQIEQVNQVLQEIGADHIPQLLIWNKIDLAGFEPKFEHDEYDKMQRVFLSARTGAGLDLLRQAISEIKQGAVSDAQSGQDEFVTGLPTHEFLETSGVSV